MIDIKSYAKTRSVRQRRSPAIDHFEDLVRNTYRGRIGRQEKEIRSVGISPCGPGFEKKTARTSAHACSPRTLVSTSGGEQGLQDADPKRNEMPREI